MPLLTFKKSSNNLSHEQKINLKGKRLVAPSTIISNDNVQNNVKCKLYFDESKSNFKQKPS
jgi:hypothetical protein